MDDLRKAKLSNSIDDNDMTTSGFDNTNFPDKTADSSLGGDDTFSKFEKLCDEENPLENFNVDINLSQLNDMEEPSHFWENTMNNMSKLMSPIKRCGLLRPSTIIEEDSQINSTASSSALSSMSTNALVDIIGNIVDDKEQSHISETSTIKSGSSSFESACYGDVGSSKSKAIALTSFTSIEESFVTAGSRYSTTEGTFKTPTASKHGDLIQFTPFERTENISDYYTVKQELDCKSEDIIEISSTDDENESLNNTLEEISSLKTDSMTRDSLASNTNTNDELNSSHEFNDTLEEVEYFLKKGSKLLEKQSEASKVIIKSPVFEKPKTPDTIKKKPVTKLDKDTDFLPPSYPKLKPFRSIQPANKKNNYDHIVSPLHLYINKTAVAPLSTGERASRRDIFETKLSSRDSRYFPNRQSSKENVDVHQTKQTHNFPKKVYISAETQHVRFFF